MRALLTCANRSRFQLGLSIVITLLLGSFSIVQAQDLRRIGLTNNNLRRTPIVEVVEKNKAAVVNIHSERTVGFDAHDPHPQVAQAQQRVNGMGTGVVIDPNGYVITNNHVVDEVQALRVRLHDGTSLSARVIIRDPAEDLAIIKIDPAKPLPVATLGTASDLMVGEPVIAIGNAFGYEHTVSTGVVSAVKRDVTLNREISYKSLIQTDACINPGNSGGPLFNIHGEVVGINVAIRAGAQGIGFAIPVDNMMRVAADMLSVRRRTGVSHGMTLRDACDVSDNPIRRWTVIERLDANSPAQRAGLKAGDVLDKLGNQKITSALDVERTFLDRPLGEKLAVSARRGADSKGEGGSDVRGDIVLKAADKASGPQPTDLTWKKLGMRVQPVAADAVTKINPQLHGGLLITEILADGLASRAGFQRGDILIGLHQWETVSIDNVVFVLNHPDLASFAPLRFFRIRGGQLQRGALPNVE
jgi:serine protease Do